MVKPPHVNNMSNSKKEPEARANVASLLEIFTSAVYPELVDALREVVSNSYDEGLRYLYSKIKII